MQRLLPALSQHWPIGETIMLHGKIFHPSWYMYGHTAACPTVTLTSIIVREINIYFQVVSSEEEAC